MGIFNNKNDIPTNATPPVATVRNELMEFNEMLQASSGKLAEADEAFKTVEFEYSEASRQFNEFKAGV